MSPNKMVNKGSNSDSITTYGLEEKHIKLIKRIFDKVYSNSELPKIYLFGSRATGKHKKFSDIDLAVKTAPNQSEKLDKVSEFLEESDLPYKVDLVDWNQIIEDYKPSIEKQKRLLWSPAQKANSSPWRACPIGEHWVRRHSKTTSPGKMGDWDGHCRANPSKKDVLKGDELSIISKSPVFSRARPKASKKSLGFKHGNDFNQLISGWTAYWNSTFQPKQKLDPNTVKALVASESGFNPNVIAANKLKVGDAQGLLQLTEQTQKILKDINGELRDRYVVLKKSEIQDPNKNIAAAIRWLFRKRETARARLKRNPTWDEVVFEYKGILKQKNKTATRIKQQYKRYLKELNAKKSR